MLDLLSMLFLDFTFSFLRETPVMIATVAIKSNPELNK